MAAIRTLGDAALTVNAKLTGVLVCYANLHREASSALEIVERPIEPEADLLSHAVVARDAASALIEQLDAAGLAARTAYAAAVAACATIQAAKDAPDA